MARAVAIDTRLEKLIPSLEEYIVTGVFTKDEVRDLSRHRTDIEYRLVAKPLLVVDVRRGIQMETDIENKISEYCRTSKITLKHRWVVQERIESIYHIGYKHLKDVKEREEIRQEMIAFMKASGRKTSLSKFYAELVVRYPLTAAYWVEATWWQVEIGAMDNARSLIQHAITSVPAAADVWVCAWAIELHFAGVVLKTVLAERRERESTADAPLTEDIVDTMRTKSGSLATIALDLALANIVLDEAVKSDAASSPTLFVRMYDTALSYEFGAAAADAVLQRAVVHRLLPCFAHEKDSKRHIHTVSWRNAFVTSPDTWKLVDTAIKFPLHRLNRRLYDGPEEYLRSNAAVKPKRSVATPEQWSHALFASVSIAVTALLDALWEGFRSNVEGAGKKLQQVLVEVLQWRAPKQTQPIVPREDQEAIIERMVQYRSGSATKLPQLIASLHPAAHNAAAVPYQSTANNVGEIVWEVTVLAKVLSAAKAATLIAEGRCSAKPSSDMLTTSEADIDELLIEAAGLPSLTEKGALVQRFLVARQFIAADATRPLSALWSPEVPLTIWKLLHLMEEAVPTTSTNAVQKQSDDSDDDEEPQRKRSRLESATVEAGKSFGMWGLQALGRRTYAKLPPAAQLQRNEGIYRLYALLMRNILHVTPLDREPIAAHIAALAPADAAMATRSADQLINFVNQYTPLPRQCYTEVERPFREGRVLAATADRTQLLNAARECHRRVIALYRALSAATKGTSTVLLSAVYGPSNGVQPLQPVEKLNAHDWHRAVQFERDVVNDLPASQKLIATAMRECLDAKEFLLLVQRHS